MGYTTDFEGRISVYPPLNVFEITYLNKFCDTRRMRTEHGPYWVDQPGFAGQDKTPEVIDYNSPPEGQPGLWCHWIPTQDGRYIEWDGGEKFYDSLEWMEYIIEHFLKPGAIVSTMTNRCPTCGRSDESQFDEFTFDHVLNGMIEAQGEDPDDKWRLYVNDNIVSRKDAKIVWD